MAKDTGSEDHHHGNSDLPAGTVLLSEIVACVIVAVVGLLIACFLRPLAHFIKHLRATVCKEPTTPTQSSMYRIKVDSSLLQIDSADGLDDAGDMTAEEMSDSFQGPMLSPHLTNQSLADLTFSFRSRSSNEVDNTSFQSPGGPRFRTPTNGRDPRNPVDIRHRTPAGLPRLTYTGDDANLVSSFGVRNTAHEAALASVSKEHPARCNYFNRQMSSDEALRDILPCYHSPDADSVAVSESASQVVRNGQTVLAQVLWWVQHHISADNKTAVAAYAVRYPDKIAAVIRSSFANKEELLVASLKVEGYSRHK